MQTYWDSIVSSKRNSLLVLFVISFLAFVPHLGIFDANLMEARNFVTAREMVAENNWFLPTMNGQPRYEKPPLPTWLTAFVILFIESSDNVFALRLPAVLAGLVLVFSLYFFAYEKSNQIQLAFITGCIGATALLIFQMARTGSWDIHCHAWMMAALVLWIKAMNTQTKKTLYFAISAFLMGLSFLSKGPIAFYTLLLPYILATLAIKDFSFKKVSFPNWCLFIVILLVTSFSWPFWVYLSHAEQGVEILEKETSAWTSRHVRPFYFYFHFSIYIGIWAIILLSSFFWNHTLKLFSNKKKYLFFIVWVISALILLSVIPEKKERYLLPLIIPMVLMCSEIFNRYIKAFKHNTFTNRMNRMLLIHCIAVSLYCMVAVIFTYNYGLLENSYSFLLWFIIMLGLFVLIFKLIQNRSNPVNSLIYTIVIQLFIIITLLPAIPNFSYSNDAFTSFKDLRSDERINKLELYSLGNLNLKHVYAIGKKVNIINPETYQNTPINFPAAIISKGTLESQIADSLKSKINITPVSLLNPSRTNPHDLYYVNIINLKDEKI